MSKKKSIALISAISLIIISTGTYGVINYNNNKEVKESSSKEANSISKNLNTKVANESDIKLLQDNLKLLKKHNTFDENKEIVFETVSADTTNWIEYNIKIKTTNPYDFILNNTDSIFDLEIDDVKYKVNLNGQTATFLEIETNQSVTYFFDNADDYIVEEENELSIINFHSSDTKFKDTNGNMIDFSNDKEVVLYNKVPELDDFTRKGLLAIKGIQDMLNYKQLVVNYVFDQSTLPYEDEDSLVTEVIQFEVKEENNIIKIKTDSLLKDDADSEEYNSTYDIQFAKDLSTIELNMNNGGFKEYLSVK